MITPAYESFVNDIAMEFLGLSQKEKEAKAQEKEAINKVNEFLSNKTNYDKMCNAFKSRAIALIKETANERDDCETGTIGDFIGSNGKKIPNPKVTDLVIEPNGGKGLCVDFVKSNYHGVTAPFVMISASIKLSKDYIEDAIENYGANKSYANQAYCVVEYDATHKKFMNITKDTMWQ